MLWSLLALVCPVVFRLTLGADPVYSPETLSDAYGNSADNSSQITWADLPAGTAYKTASPSRLSAGLEPYYNLVHSFIGTVFAQGIPNDIIEKAANNSLGDIPSNYNQYIPYIIGYAICVAIGFLFILIFPIVACCFCCCRCCCKKCGGKMYQSLEDAKNTRKKMIYAAILTGAIAFLITGTACIYVNNDNTSDAINSVTTTTKDNLHDLKLYVNNTVEQVNHIVVNNFNFFQNVIYRDLDNIAYLVGLPLRENIENQTGIRTTLTNAYSLTSDLETANTSLADVEAKLFDLNTSLNALTTALNTTKSSIDAIFTACGGSCPAPLPNYNAQTGVDDSQFPDLSGPRSSMNSVLNSNLTASINDSLDELDSIPQTVATDSNATIESLKSTIANLSDEVDPVVREINDIQGEVIGENATLDVDKLSERIDDYEDKVEQYDKYRWYGGTGLAGIVLLTTLLAAVGLIFGVLGTCTYTEPYDRGCMSNCGGILLMASVGFVCIFSAFLMLLTTLTFIFGAPMHAFICTPITDLDEMADVYSDAKVGAGYYYMGDVLLDNKSIAVTLPGVLRDCKSGKSAYSAFHLDTKFDLSDLLNYSKTLDVQGEIDAINVNMSNVDVFSSSLQTTLSDAKAALDVNFTAFYAELNNDPSTLNLTQVADDIDTYAADKPEPFKTNLETEADGIRSIRDNEYAHVQTNVTALNTSVANLEAAIGVLPTQISDLETGLSTTQNYIQVNGSAAVTSILTSFANRVLGIVDSYKDFTLNAVTQQMGSCEPVWNLYNAMFVYTFCYNLLDTFNAFWFSLGWCIFFFMPAAVFSVRLAKFFRRMTPDNKISPSPREKPGYPDGPEVNDNFEDPPFSRNANGFMTNESVPPNPEGTQLYGDMSHKNFHLTQFSSNAFAYSGMGADSSNGVFSNGHVVREDTSNGNTVKDQDVCFATVHHETEYKTVPPPNERELYGPPSREITMKTEKEREALDHEQVTYINKDGERVETDDRCEMFISTNEETKNLNRDNVRAELIEVEKANDQDKMSETGENTQGTAIEVNEVTEQGKDNLSEDTNARVKIIEIEKANRQDLTSETREDTEGTFIEVREFTEQCNGQLPEGSSARAEIIEFEKDNQANTGEKEESAHGSNIEDNEVPEQDKDNIFDENNARVEIMEVNDANDNNNTNEDEYDAQGTIIEVQQVSDKGHDQMSRGNNARVEMLEIEGESGQGFEPLVRAETSADILVKIDN